MNLRGPPPDPACAVAHAVELPPTKVVKSAVRAQPPLGTCATRVRKRGLQRAVCVILVCVWSLSEGTLSLRAQGLFDREIRRRKLEALGAALVVLDRIAPWEMFRQTPEAMRPVRDPRKGGRPPRDALRMFKVLVLELDTLSDEHVEYQIADRLSFQRFLGMDLTQEAPDYTAVWRFRGRLGPERMQALFAELNGYIELAGFEARKGQMIDARGRG